MASSQDPNRLESLFGETHEDKSAAKAQRQALRELSRRWGKEHRDRVDALTRELLAAAPDAPSDEVMLLRTAATTSAVSEVLSRAQLQLASRLEQFVDNPKLLLTLARALREVTAIQSASAKSFQQLLEAAGTMRAQRAIVRTHKKNEVWHAQVGGALDSSRRDSSGRHPSSN
jgi:hypothetical protein